MFRKLFNISKSIEIDWSTPKLITSIIDKNVSFDWGLYQITTKIGKNEYLLYVGKSWHDLSKRIKDHNKKWLNDYDGDKYVRLGYFNTEITEKQLLDIESAIIFELKPIQNIKSTQTYNPSDEYNIYSLGETGYVPKLIKTKEH